MNELKPCPFCGGKAKIKIVSADDIALMLKLRWHKVFCLNCDAKIERYDVTDAIEAWNRRVKENNDEID